MSFVRTFLSDARLGLRSLGRTPGFWLAASATLALGIGANASIPCAPCGTSKGGPGVAEAIPYLIGGPS